MYLKSIKAHGFKSFADVIELDIKEGITGIVGPNGSGKSNIVDAVRWVLGEQSLKALRGTNNFSDIIFAGSKSRSSMNRAYVTLTFDNSDRYLNSDFNTLEIKRVLYKSGDNEYFINNTKVRLKDIIDLFIDSGSGKESFNIISQGSIGDIINSKPEDRRSIFESAAGILKYKKRKEETNRKLIKVQDNLDKIRLIIGELQDNKDHLEKQASQAQKYLDNKTSLEKIEVALIVEDITRLNNEYKLLDEEIKKLNEEINKSQVADSVSNTKLESLKLNNLNIDEKIAELNEKLLNLTKEISDLNSQKQLTLERKKYEVGNNLVENNILNLREDELILLKNIENLKKDIELLNNKLEENEKEYELISNDLQDKNALKNKKELLIEKYNKDHLNLLNQIEIINANLENDVSLPFAVKSILNNPRLKGIHSTIGKLIEINASYTTAIDIALGYSANIIVVDDEISAKAAISYIKDNKLGRATFFPLNVIKSKMLDNTTLNIIKKEQGFIGIASDLVSYDKKYKNIIENQLGNIIVVDNIDNLNKIGKLVNYRYRVVSLDGEVLHTGGAISGGSSKKEASSIIKLKEKLKKLQLQEQQISILLQDNENDLKQGNVELVDLQNKLNNYISKITQLKESLNRQTINLNDLEQKYQTKHNELVGIQNIKDVKLDESLNQLLESYYKKNSEKELVTKELNELKTQKNDTFLAISDLEKENKETSAIYKQKMQILKNNEIKKGKLDIQLDNLLNTLNHTYNMTYDKAKQNYKLELETNVARQEIEKLKKLLISLGNVNLGAIEEFERINTRYEFLTNQKKDLEESIINLNEVIEEMDIIMQDRFVKTFKSIQKEFNLVYQKLFKGGYGRLELTNPDNILETGIDIIAQPPGKKLNSIGLLSGGEKTLTAIALLFAILNVKPVPFIILDEVEAALDDANVETFGKYLLEKRDRSQFIIITHKKKTMEYVDVLYGITMQESGISKLVSVKLENI